MNTFSNNTLNTMNYSKLWQGTIITPPINKDDMNLYVIIPTGECTLDGRVHKAILQRDYVKFTAEDKKRENLMY